MSKLSVVVPCYNEEESLPLFYQEVSAVLKDMGTDYEIVFIDDGSSDGTPQELRKLAAADSRCRYIIFSRNFGKEAGMYAGLAEAEGEYCVIMDADLQHPPGLLPQMYKAVTEEGYDCCGGKRKGRQGDGALRSFLSRSFYKVGKKLTKLDMSDGYGDFRMMRRTVVDALLEMKEYNRYMKGLYSFVGFTTKWIEYENVERVRGETKWSLKSLFSYAAEGIFSFSTVPLKLAGAVGILLFFAALIVIAVNLTSLSRTDLLLFFILFLSSLQMLFIYILGAYLSRDYLENKRRPVYIVKEKPANKKSSRN